MDETKIQVKYNDDQGQEVLDLINYKIRIEHYGITTIKMVNTRMTWDVAEKNKNPKMFQLAEKIYHNKHKLNNFWNHNDIKDLNQKGKVNINMTFADNAINFLEYILNNYIKD